MGQIQLFQLASSEHQVVGDDWHTVVGQVDLPEPVRDVLVAREHFTRYETYSVMAQVHLKVNRCSSIQSKTNTCYDNFKISKITKHPEADKEISNKCKEKIHLNKYFWIKANKLLYFLYPNVFG